MRTVLPVVNVSPPELDLFDLDERDQLRNQIYCEELAAAMLEAELDPRNFFRLAKTGRRGL
jgi:hypothetical protein